jgi:Family of unknown function (DUF6878)
MAAALPPGQGLRPALTSALRAMPERLPLRKKTTGVSRIAKTPVLFVLAPRLAPPLARCGHSTLRHQRYGGMDCRSNNTQERRATLMMTDFWEEQQAFKKLAASLNEGNKAALFDALQKAGITVVIVDFDGCGDSRQIENIIAKARDQMIDLPEEQTDIALAFWGQPEPTRKTLPIREAIEEIAYSLLEHEHDGWEIDDGAFGEFDFDVISRKIVLTINARYTDVHTSEQSF